MHPAQAVAVRVTFFLRAPVLRAPVLDYFCNPVAVRVSVAVFVRVHHVRVTFFSFGFRFAGVIVFCYPCAPRYGDVMKTEKPEAPNPAHVRVIWPFSGIVIFACIRGPWVAFPPERTKKFSVALFWFVCAFVGFLRPAPVVWVWAVLLFFGDFAPVVRVAG